MEQNLAVTILHAPNILFVWSEAAEQVSEEALVGFMEETLRLAVARFGARVQPSPLNSDGKFRIHSARYSAVAPMSSRGPLRCSTLPSPR